MMGVKRTVLILLAVLTAALLAFPETRQSPLQTIGRPLASLIAFPLQAVDVVSQAIDGVLSRYVALRHSRQENLDLRQDIARLQMENAQLRERAAEVERLRATLRLSEEYPYATTAARVIGRDPTNWYRSIVIDKGRRDGLAVDMGIMTPAGAAGRIVKVYDQFAVALLLIDRNNAITGVVQGTRDEGIVEGTEKGLARIKYLPLLSTVKVGDDVITSGLAGGFPRGLPIGRITKIERREAELFLSAEIEPYSDFTKLEEVLVITKPRDTTSLPANPFPLRPPSPDKRESGESR